MSANREKENMDKQNKEIENKNNRLRESERQLKGIKREIDDKTKLLGTRNLMLQESVERNIYNKKVYHSLIAVLLFFGVVIIGLLYYKT